MSYYMASGIDMETSNPTVTDLFSSLTVLFKYSSINYLGRYVFYSVSVVHNMKFSMEIEPDAGSIKRKVCIHTGINTHVLAGKFLWTI